MESHTKCRRTTHIRRVFATTLLPVKHPAKAEHPAKTPRPSGRRKRCRDFYHGCPLPWPETVEPYGLTMDDYRRLLDVQGHRCAICKRHPRTYPLQVDHSHLTSAVRGLLCSRCNHLLLGSAHDQTELLENALAYLRHPPAGAFSIDSLLALE